MQRTDASWFEKEKPYCFLERTIQIEGCPDLDLVNTVVPSKSPYSDFFEERAFEEQAKRLLAERNARQREEQRLEAESEEREISEIATEVAPQMNLTEDAARHIVRLARNERQRLEKFATERAHRRNTDFRTAYLSLLNERRGAGGTETPPPDNSGSHSVDAQLLQLENEFVDHLLADQLLPDFVRLGASSLQASQIDR
jgi:hypothetical protein